MPDPTPRRYDDKEVSLILRRATELQRAEPSARNPTGLTLAELEDIAVEAGIDPAMLRRAARDVEAHPPSTFNERLAGAPVRIALERIVPGEYPEDRLGELVPVIQVATAGQGQASAVGASLTWSSRTESNTTSQQVLVSANNGETVIRLEERYGGLAGGLFGGIVGGVTGGVGFGLGGALSAFLGSVAVGITFPILALTGSYLLARSIFAKQVAKRQRAAEALMDELEERVRHHVQHRLPPES